LTAEAAGCHHYHYWAFRYPQRCRVIALAPDIMRRRVVRPPPSPERIAIPLPSLDWIECPEGDSRLRGVALLRELNSR
jgi:hypothetical protein